METHSTPLVSAKAAWPPLVKEVRGRGRGQDGEGGESDGSHSLTHRRHPPWGQRGGSPWANDTSYQAAVAGAEATAKGGGGSGGGGDC